MLSHSDTSIKYETSLILVNLTFYNELQYILSSSEKNLNQILIFIQTNQHDLILLENILLLIKHILYNDKGTQSFFIKNKLVSIFEFILVQYKQKFHIHFAIFKCVLILATIQINSLTHKQEYIKIIEILIPWLNISLLKANNEKIIINLHFTILAFRELSLIDFLLDYMLHQYNT